jgi:uncharacterized protein (TIGR02646 family)
MIRINKSVHTNPLIVFSELNPNSTWDDFRSCNNGESYKVLQSIVFNDQNDLCAYCEVNTKNIPLNRRLEHFISKSLDIYHHTNWSNIIGVCVGGEDFETKKLGHVHSQISSCDSHKSHLENLNNALNRDWTGLILNPLSIPSDHKLFNFNKRTGELSPNLAYCQINIVQGNLHESTEKFVEETLRVLNLNCHRLCEARKSVFYSFERRVKKFNEKRDMDGLLIFARSWLDTPIKEFQTTRNIIIRDNKFIAGRLKL